MRIFLVALLSLLGSACALSPTPDVIFTPTKVNIAVPTSCIKPEDIPVEPNYALNSVKLTDTIDEKGTAALREVEQRRGWQELAKVILKSCSTPITN